MKLGRKRSGWDYSYQRKMMLMFLVGLLLNIIDKNHWTQTDKVSICVFISRLLVVDEWISIDFHNFFMENEMFLHILVNLYMILYRFFVLLYNIILDNKIYNLINAHEVQTVSLKKGWWERKTMSKNMEIWLLHVGSTWTTMLHANKWLSWRTEMSSMNLMDFLLFFSYYTSS